ncbi:sensor histidine kinase [Culicoidibacter larvae]|nr:HAMP domain-containing sensor histidine kinase [Culicoidibacter larvae]
MAMTFIILIAFYLGIVYLAESGIFTVNVQTQLVDFLSAEELATTIGPPEIVTDAQGNVFAVDENGVLVPVEETHISQIESNSATNTEPSLEEMESISVIVNGATALVSYDIYIQIAIWGTAMVLVLSIISFMVTRFLSNRLISPLIQQTDQIIKLEDAPIYSELQPLQEEYAALYEKEQQMIAEKNEFAAYTSHELRNFLTLLSAKSEILGQSDAKAAIEEIRSDINNFKPVLDELLDYAHLNDTEPELEPVNIAEIVASICDQYSTAQKDVIFNFVESENYMTYGKSALIERAVINLVNNGLRHADNNQVIINLDTFEDKIIRLDIINTGNPIADEMLEQIWQPFFTKSDDGVGLGLSFVKKSIEQCQGTISVTSDIEQTTFHIEFIMAKEDIQ